MYLPTTPNDYGGMIYSLLQEQSSRIANKDGAQVNLLPLICCPACLIHSKLASAYHQG